MKNADMIPFGGRVIVTLAALMIVIAGLQFLKPILVPVVYAFFLAVLGIPPSKFLEKKGVPKGIAVFIVASVILVIVSGLLVVLVSSAQAFSKELPHFLERFRVLWESLTSTVARFGVELNGIQSMLGESKLLVPVLSGLIGQVFRFASSVALVLVLMLFMLVEAPDFYRKCLVLYGKNSTLDRLRGVAGDVQRYLLIKTITSAVTGVLVLLFTWCCGLRFSSLWGGLSFLFNFIPIIGSIAASVPAIALTSVEHSPTMLVVVVVGYILINSGVSHLLEPVLMGRRLGLSALVVLLSLVFWGWLWGVSGALLSVPLTMMIKIFLEHTADMTWAAVLLGPGDVEFLTEKKRNNIPID